MSGTSSITSSDTRTAHDRASSATKRLLAIGVTAGPFYVLVSLAQALTRDGFDLTRHSWSLLANGDLGWIQIMNFILTGLMVSAFAVGLRRALRPGVGSIWAPRLVAAYGISLIAAGVLRADPGSGFPPGTPEGPGEVSWHGLGHLAAGAIGFFCLVAACFVVARRLARDGRRGAAIVSRIIGVAFLAGFAGVASGAGGATVPAFAGSVVLVWAWLSALAAHLYRSAARVE